MRLCFISPSDSPRTVVNELALKLVTKRNYEVTILQPTNNRRLVGKTYPETAHKRIEIIYFPSFFLPKTDYVIPYFHKENKVIYKLLSESQCEVIQACDYDYLTSIAPIFIKRKCNLPIVLTTDALPGYSWSYGDVIVDVAAKLYTYSIGRWILKGYDAVILLYKALADEAKSLGVPQEKIHVIPNGIDFQDFRKNTDVNGLRAKFSIQDDERILLYVGRLSDIKRLEILIALTKKLLRDGLKVKTVIVGEGYSRKDLERLSSSIKRNVVFAGYVPHDQIYKYYFMTDVFVLPSLSEGLPTVLLEASAAGKPSVASHVNGVPDIVIHGETGFLVDKSDINSYVRYVKLLLADENLLRNMGKKAAEFVKENFNWNTVVDKYDGIYRRIVN